MSIALWRYRRGAISLEKMMEIELLPSRIEGASWMKDSVMALVVNAPNLIFYVSVARADDGYYSCVDYETPTGGAHSGVYKRGMPYPSKLEAIRAAIKKSLDNDWITDHSGNRGHLEAALKELKKYEYKQLTLF